MVWDRFFTGGQHLERAGPRRPDKYGPARVAAKCRKTARSKATFYDRLPVFLA
jgi:hypothetical protein